MQNILVPTDFSENAMKAVLYAAEIAKKSSSTVYLLHVIEPLTDRISQPNKLRDTMEQEIASENLNELKSLQQTITTAYPGVKTGTKLANGSVYNIVSEFTRKNQIDLIIMGTKGANGLKEVFMGSVTAATIGRTKIPVLAIPDEYKMEEPNSILFATNRFEENKDLLNKIIELALFYSATLHVAVFLDTNTADATVYLDNTRKLNNYIDFLKKAYPDITFKGELLEGSEFEDTMEKYITENEVDIIAMITYPKSFWERVMKKSMTKKIAFHTKIPLLAIPGT